MGRHPDKTHGELEGFRLIFCGEQERRDDRNPAHRLSLALCHATVVTATFLTCVSTTARHLKTLGSVSEPIERPASA
jgi:hypothetical protein